MTTEDSAHVDFYAEMVGETLEAVRFFDGLERFWVPRALVVELERLRDGRNCRVRVPQWYARKSGIV